MSSKIKITFLGTSAQIPTSKKNHTSILLSTNNENILVDCGEGTQRQFRKARLNPMKLTKILITHWHGDHTLGIPGLLQTLAAKDYNKKLNIYGPRGTKKFIKKMFKAFMFSGKINLEIKDVEDSLFFENKDFCLYSQKLSHSIPCNAYAFIKKGQIKIDKKKLEKSKIKKGPILKELKEGKDIIYKNKKYFVKDLTYKEEDKKISFILDTKFNKKISKFAKNSDLLICESTYSSNESIMADKYKHLTSEQAAKIAKESNSKKLILTHLSSRYEKRKREILEDAKKIFKKTFLAKDLDKFEI